ncbi:hypothetical protein J4207_02635 [Candidatus Woesearchaeota archaeon]|nr:hypothetical protein [Candidatus Woesearchaeota archaeon]
MAVRYKQKCSRCRKNYVSVTWKTKFPVCYECEKTGLQGEIKDPQMKKMFDIPLEFYQESMFLRDIKINYLRYGKLSDKQIEAFKKVVKKMKEPKKKKEIVITDRI